MMNEIVCYKNDMNVVPMRNFNSVEMDLFFSICSQMKEKGSSVIEFTFDELKVLSDYKPTSKQRFADDIESVYRKLLSLQFHKKDLHKRGGFVLFTSYEIDLDKETVKIKTNSDFEYILNELSKEFTRFELEEFTNLRSSYSKTAYRLLKQFRTTGYRIFEIDEFRDLLCIPSSYKMFNINQKILTPIESELSSIFRNFAINKIKKNTRGNKVTHIEFTFNPESNIKNKVEETILLEEKNENLELNEKINIVKNSIPILSEDDIKILIEIADISVILEKYYTLAIGKDIDNLTGFLMAAIKNNWKKAPAKAVEKKAVAGEMDELERKLQKRLFEKLNKKNI